MITILYTMHSCYPNNSTFFLYLGLLLEPQSHNEIHCDLLKSFSSCKGKFDECRVKLLN